MADVAQLAANILITGSLYVLMAVGLTMVYRIMRFANFAHAELITLGAYTAYSLNQLGFSIYIALPFAFTASALLAVSLERMVFMPIRDRGGDVISLMIASIGAGMVVRHLLQQVYSARVLTYNIPLVSYELLGARVSQTQLVIVLLGILSILLFHLLLTGTTLGRAMRATSDNPGLARASGIPVHRVMLLTWVLGGGIAGMAGVLRAADTRLVPTLGWEVLLPVFAVVLLGGIGSFYGAVAAAYLLAAAENVGVLVLSSLGISTGYRYAISFVILILVLLFRPHGIAGSRLGGERE